MHVDELRTLVSSIQPVKHGIAAIKRSTVRQIGVHHIHAHHFGVAVHLEIPECLFAKLGVQFPFLPVKYVFHQLQLSFAAIVDNISACGVDVQLAVPCNTLTVIYRDNVAFDAACAQTHPTADGFAHVEDTFASMLRDKFRHNGAYHSLGRTCLQSKSGFKVTFDSHIAVL